MNWLRFRFVLPFFIGACSGQKQMPEHKWNERCFLKSDAEILLGYHDFFLDSAIAVDFTPELSGLLLVKWPDSRLPFHAGDRIIDVDGCKLKDVVMQTPDGINMSPGLEAGYCTRFDYVLLKPQTEWVGVIRSITVSRNGKSMIIKVPAPPVRSELKQQ